MRNLILLLAIAPWAKGICGEDVRNPLAGDPEAVGHGRVLFVLACGSCHGVDARGSRGPDLTSGAWNHGESDTAVFGVIRRGVPATEMPGTGLRDEEVWMIIAYLRTLGGHSEPVNGDAAKGRQTFQTMCAYCHMINGVGGRFGPDLSRIGSARSPRSLAESTRNPGAEVAPGYKTVTVVKKDGARIRGVVRNEDTFSIQIMDLSTRIHRFLKTELEQVKWEPGSLMPAFGPDLLSAVSLTDLVAFMHGLKEQ